MKKNKLGLFNLTVFAVCVLLASCDNFFVPETKGETPQAYNNKALSRKIELAIWHTAENYETSVETLQGHIQALLQSDTESRSRSSVTNVYSYSVTVENGFSSLPANRRPPNTAPERSVIPFYVFQLENSAEGTSGFAFTCGDQRIGDTLAIVENGDFHDTQMPFWQIFLGCLDEYIEETIAVYNSISDLDIEAALTVSNGGLNRSFNVRALDVLPDKVELKTVTRWNQGEPYNHVLNKMAGKNDPKNFWSTGCAAVAMGHIMAYHEWPLKPPSSIRQSVQKPFWYNFSGTPKSTFYDPFSNSTKSFSSINYNWEEMKKQSDTNNIDNEYQMHIGVLMLAIGDKTNMKYSNGNGSGSLWDDVISGFEEFGYNIGSDVVSYDFELVKNMIKESKPVMMGGSEGSFFSDGGHYWVIDGYMSTDVADYVHCIPGWGDSKVGWYKSNVFDMSKVPLKEPPGTINPRTIADKENYFRFNLNIFTDIYPNNNKITINVVDGVPIPVAGFIPRPEENTVIKIVETEQFTGTVKWLVPTDNGVLDEIGVGKKFADGIEYTAEITLAPKKGLTFQGVEADFFTVTGAVSASNSDNSGLIAAVFPPAINLFASGNGIESDPFIINTVEELNNLFYFNHGHFKLETDIDLQNIPWTPIPEFHGTLDGDNKTISNLNMTFTNGVQRFDYHTNSISYGLFAFNKGTIRKLKVTANINLTNIPGNYSLQGDTEIVVGVIAAKNNGMIQDCTVSSSNGNPMINSIIHTGNVAGGITGYNYNTVASCTNNGDIHSSLTTGGIIGCNIGVTRNSDNNALIRYTYNNMNNAIGGIVGVNLLGYIESGTNTGTIAYANSASTSQLIQPNMGHIAGKNSSGSVKNGMLNFNSGTVNTGTLQTVGSHNQALYAGNRALGRGYIFNGNAIIYVP